jgi:RNA polymerase sigma-70 factor (ECF subfamily)
VSVLPLEPSDSALLARIADGDLAPLGELYGRYAAILRPMASCILRDVGDAEDLLHDVFLRLADVARDYSEDRGSVVAWLMTLVRNRSIDGLRRRQGRRALELGRLAHEPQPRVVTPEALSTRSEEGVRLRRAVDALPYKQRVTLERAFFEGLSYPEIAARERLPLGTVKSRVNRGLATLRAALED